MIALKTVPRWLDRHEVRRWLTVRCVSCGHRFRWRRDARHSQNSDIYHGPCLALIHWRNHAEERLTVVDLAMSVAGLSGNDLQQVAELRDGHTGRDRVWRVVHDLDLRREREVSR